MMKLRASNSPAGFTLVELLVVVLIVGLLAAYAIPQYFKLLEKSRAAEITDLAPTIIAAESRFINQYGAPTFDFTQLDVTIPGYNPGQNYGCTVNPNYFGGICPQQFQAPVGSPYPHVDIQDFAVNLMPIYLGGGFQCMDIHGCQQIGYAFRFTRNAPGTWYFGRYMVVYACENGVCSQSDSNCGPSQSASDMSAPDRCLDLLQ